jgi:acetylornithine/succinyldiaminopimelate/putrescine aminotransferase
MTFDLAGLLESRRGENFRLHSQYLSPQLPRVLETLGFDRFYTRGAGSYLYDAGGRRYLDLLSGFGVYALGRSHPTVLDALHQALDADLPNLVQLDCALLPGVLAEALVAKAHPGIERVFFTNSGAEAVETAIKFARRATGRGRILYADHAFHGLTTGALSLTGGKEFRKGFGKLLPGVDVVPFGDLEALRRELRKRDVAAFIVEPIQGKGVNVAADEYWPAAEELCRQYKTLLVLDEIQAGMGRTGRFFCHEHWGIQPDIITMSKALAPLVERHEFLHAVRGKGLMIGLVFGPPTSRALRMRWRAVETMRRALFSQLVVVPLFHRHGIITQVAADGMNVVKLLPPLIAGEEEVDYFVAALDDVLTSAEQGSSLFFEVGRTMARGAMRRTRH